ncbi:hypothetical protein CU044_7563 [Streptomyces sp. L-9-10]|uniref:hypothetical protein n=1 Tax=Streptomyces sp. L-9-10 TaxID=1478131 RepID=UPI00101D90F2|nr:hypothetical protein [Streptomyces sp. L-9-10]RYJ19716.1 hypothetical protein CU044_7563 [Streptomyces sp. L-9-10]
MHAGITIARADPLDGTQDTPVVPAQRKAHLFLPGRRHLRPRRRRARRRVDLLVELAVVSQAIVRYVVSAGILTITVVRLVSQP